MDLESINFPKFVKQGTPLCSETDPEIFYAEEQDISPSRHSAKYKYEREAKAICRKCDLQEACLQFALENHEQGIWGGTNESDRAKIRRLLRINRSR